MFGWFFRLFSKNRNADTGQEEEIELTGLGYEDDDDDDEKTQMVNTLAYHQPPKHAIAEKARKLAEGENE